MHRPGALLLLLVFLVAGCRPAGDTLVVYSGRSQALVDELLTPYEDERPVQVRYGRDAELLLALAEEGVRSPAHVFWGNTAGALGAAGAEGRLQPLPASLLDQPAAFVPSGGQWVPLTVRFRVLAYAPERLDPATLPASVLDLPGAEALRGRIGWTPTYSSFHDFVTALRMLHGEDVARDWLTAMQAMQPRAYPGNSAMLEALEAGEIDVALTNHYYVLRARANARTETPGVATHHFAPGDVGNLALVTGAGVLTTANDPEAAHRFLSFLLAPETQSQAARQTFEYPVVRGAAVPEGSLSFDEALALSPDLDFEQLRDLEATLNLLRERGLL